MSRRNRAFTLIELLVVMAIMMMLFGIVISGLQTSRTDGDIRRGARQFASVLLASQSLSLGSPTGAAVIVSSEGTRGEMFSQARRFPFIEGTVSGGMPDSSTDVGGSSSFDQVELAVSNEEPLALVHGYRIRFLDRVGGADGPPSDWFGFENKPMVASACHEAEMTLQDDGTRTCSACGEECGTVVRPSKYSTVSHRSDSGQTAYNTVWPTLPNDADGTLAFQTARYPIPAGLSQRLPKGVVIDLRHSGYGDPTLANWGNLANRGAIGIGFDTVGSVDAVMQNVLPMDSHAREVQPLAPHEPIYFFVTAESDVTDPNVNALASDKAVWVVVHPRSGRVTISPNVPQFTDDISALRAARDKARRGVTLGG